MSDFKLDLNFGRLKDYFPNITEEQKARIKQQGGLVPNLEWDYADNAVHYEMFNALLTILKRYDLQEHINELYYAIIILDDNCKVTQEMQEIAYNDSQTTKEVAQFLLTLKTAKENQSFQLVAKSAINTAPIKNTEVAKWMCDLIYNAIESKQFPIADPRTTKCNIPVPPLAIKVAPCSIFTLENSHLCAAISRTVPAWTISSGNCLA